MKRSSKQTNIMTCAWALTALLTTSCEEGDLGMAKGFVGSSTYTALIDSVSVELSTVKADSVQTSGRAGGLVGYFSNPMSGGQQATAFFGISIPDDFTWEKDRELIDSIAFIIKPNGYTIGDTTSTMALRVHQLSELIVRNNSGYLNNINRVPYQNDALGQRELVVWPNDGKSISIRLDTQFAEDLVAFMQENKNATSYTTMFREEFKGFALVSDTLSSRCIIGIDNSEANCMIKMYSHVVNLEKETKETIFPLQSGSYHFTGVEETNTVMPWSAITSSGIRLPEHASHNKCLMQNTTGYFIRIDFPFLNNLLEIKKQGRIVKANLILRPVPGYVRNDDLPATLYVSTITKLNTPGEFLYNANGDPVSPVLYRDNIHNENTSYVIDITNYLNTRIGETIIDTNQGLALVFPEDNGGTQLDYLVLGGHYNKEYKSELHIYYYYYDTK